MAAVPGRDRAFDMNLDAAAEGLKAYVDDEDHDSDGDTPDASRCRGGIVLQRAKGDVFCGGLWVVSRLVAASQSLHVDAQDRVQTVPRNNN